jgi:hypothetical protein
MENNKLITGIESEFDPDTFTLFEDLGPERFIDIDDLADELARELEVKLFLKGFFDFDYINDEFFFVPIQHEEAFYDIIRLRINILNRFKNILTSKQLFAIYRFTNSEAEYAIFPLDRRYEIFKEMYRIQDLENYDISNKNEFIELLKNIDPDVFYELTEILYESKVIKYCSIKPTFALERLFKILESIEQASLQQENVERINIVKN